MRGKHRACRAVILAPREPLRIGHRSAFILAAIAPHQLGLDIGFERLSFIHHAGKRRLVALIGNRK